MSLKGYLPPEGPQNVHRVPYNYIEAQGSHRVADAVVYGPESVILTGDEDAQAQMEEVGLEQIPGDVAEEALDAYQDEDGDAGAVIEEWDGSHEEADDEDPGESSDPDEGADGPAIPENLDDVPYRGESTVTLQHLAQSYGIQANQSAEELREQLAKVRGGE